MFGAGLINMDCGNEFEDIFNNIQNTYRRGKYDDRGTKNFNKVTYSDHKYEGKMLKTFLGK